MTKIVAETQTEFHEKRVERDEHDEMLKEKVRAVLQQIEDANESGVLGQHIDKKWVQAHISKTRYYASHTHLTGALEALYTELCASPVTCLFIISFLTVTPKTHQIAQQYAKLLQDRLTFVERVNK